jgi:hypothetical protein
MSEAKKLMKLMDLAESDVVKQKYDFGGTSFVGVTNPEKYIPGLIEYIKKYGGAGASKVNVSTGGQPYQIVIAKPGYEITKDNKVIDAIDRFVTDKTDWRFSNSKF